MAQDYEMIGQASPELEAVAQEHIGWGPTVSQPTVSDTPQSLGEEQTDRTDFSFWDKQSNKQLLYEQVPNMAGHVETPMAAVQPEGISD